MKHSNQNIEVKNYGEARLFKHSILEIFTKTNPLVHIITYGSIVSFLLYCSTKMENAVIPIPIQITTFISGFFGGTLFEYVMHHYIFHIVSHIKLIQRILYFLHGNHHEFSRDEQRLFMLPLLGLLIIGILFIIFYFAISRFAFLFLSSMILGYMLYSLMHYSMRAFKPPHILRSLWKHHYLQHYKFPDKAYGVSSPLWDYLFGTMPSTTEDRPNKA